MKLEWTRDLETGALAVSLKIEAHDFKNVRLNRWDRTYLISFERDDATISDQLAVLEWITRKIEHSNRSDVGSSDVAPMLLDGEKSK